jgi:5-methylcytosine-specific restriction endonuclease McrA
MNRQSRICRACYLAASQRPQNYVERTCRWCERTFTVHRSQVGNYCSRSCRAHGAGLARGRAEVDVRCQNCGVVFSRHASEVRRSKLGVHFCSLACWYTHNRGEKHHLWEGGQHERINPEGVAWRRAVLERDHFYCRRCLARRHLQVHHVLPFASHPERRWDVDNGITLCADCHRLFRHRELEYAELLSLMATTPFGVIDLEAWDYSALALGRPDAE